ncbi:MAG TPA: cell division protein ZapA [Lactobacillaceae bacterium]|jgi:cell division protein ZapA
MTQQNQRRVSVELAGKTYWIKGDASVAHFRATEQLVNQQLQQIQTVAPQLSFSDQTLLLTFNVLSDQLKKQAEVESLRAEVATLQAQLQATQADEKPALPLAKNTIEAAKQASHLKTLTLFKERDE